MNRAPVAAEQFQALRGLSGVAHAFTLRAPGVDVAHEKAEVLSRLNRAHLEVRAAHGVGEFPFITAQQVHGNRIAVVDRLPPAGSCFNDCDGLITNQRGVCLGIYAADCCAVFFADPVRSVIAVVHSGKKGTELGIVPETICTMSSRFGTAPADLVVQLSPCIRPPHYEIDFAAEIVTQAKTAGVQQVHDCGTCTACNLERYYSYRAEKGRTGRMLAFLALTAAKSDS